MPPAPPPQGNQEQGHMGVVWIIAGLFMLVFGTWYFAHAQIVTGFFFVKRIEIDVLQIFTSSLDNVKMVVGQTDPSTVNFAMFSQVATQVGNYLRFPVVIILGIFAALLFFRSSAVKYDQVYTMKTFVSKEVQNWPHSIPSLSQNLVKQDIHKGPWAMALSPMQFSKKYKLLQEPEKYQEIMQLHSQAKYKVKVIRDKANQVFSMQLGRTFRGVEQLRPHTKALFAAFIARGAKDENASTEFLYQISRSAASGNLNFSGMDQLLKKYIDQEEVQMILKQHNYELTMMSSLIEYARTDGVLSSADFLWLKPLDRRLWFMLNAVGRQTAMSEVAGVYAHWIVEKKLKRRLKTPMIEQATVALETAIDKSIYHVDK